MSASTQPAAEEWRALILGQHCGRGDPTRGCPVREEFKPRHTIDNGHF